MISNPKKLKKVVYLSGTRADFGLLKSTLMLLEKDNKIELQIIATTMHNSKKYGLTVNEIKKDFKNVISINSLIKGKSSGKSMANNISRTINGCLRIFDKSIPDFLIILGDRGEMLAGAIAASHLNIPVIHIHGGERSGTIDEPIRHAISKISHYHLVSNINSRKRLIKMGENKNNIHVVGAPGLDDIKKIKLFRKNFLCSKFNIDPNRKLALLIYHPIIQDIAISETHIKNIINCCVKNNIQIFALLPNSDSGSDSIRNILSENFKFKNIILYTHLERNYYLSIMKICDFIIGNSSSGIIESASFNIPSINVGNRQNYRDRNKNTIDVCGDIRSINTAIKKALKLKFINKTNIYGDGRAGIKIHKFINNLNKNNNVLFKVNSY